MKVTFTCEKCGGNAFHFYQESGVVNTVIPPCPNCSKLTYGPLTEEMVAEALTEAFHGDGDGPKPGIPAQARFVLRLLNHSDNFTQKVLCPSSSSEWRDWLLGLARKP